MANTSTGKLKSGPQKRKTTTKKTSAEKSIEKSKDAAQSKQMRLIERRKHPRFLLSGEQFKEVRTRRIFAVYDLSLNGLSLKVDEQHWPVGSCVTGVLNLHPDSIDLSARLVAYYGERAALKFEVMSTYARSILARSLSAARLGKSLMQVREKLPVADHWFHGVCNTDLLIKLDTTGELSRVEIFFSNFYFAWSAQTFVSQNSNVVTGLCQSFGRDRLSEFGSSEEPVALESLDLILDQKPDLQKIDFARSIVEASLLDPRLKKAVIEKFKT